MIPSKQKQATPKALAVTGPGNVVDQKQTGSSSASPGTARAGAKPCAKCKAKHGPKAATLCPNMKQGGAGSGRHSVGDAVDKYNAERKKKLEPHTVKQSARESIAAYMRMREGGPGSGPVAKLEHELKASKGKVARAINAADKDPSHPGKLAAANAAIESHNAKISEYMTALDKQINDTKAQLAALKANPPVGMAKQSAKPRLGTVHFMGRLRESADGQGKTGKRFRVTLLQEGLGNFGDAFYYTTVAIESAVPIFEGKKFMVDHPAESEEMDRPERSVRDIAGYFENVAAEEMDGRLCLVGDLVVAGDPSDPKDPFARERALMQESLVFQAKHPDDALVGLSINAGGEFETMSIEQFLESADIPEACKPKLAEAVKQGVREIRPVSEMRSAVSCDLVTTAGAGGSVNQLLEGGKSTMGLKAKAKPEMDPKDEPKAEGQEGEEAQQHEGEEDSTDGDDQGADHDDADGQTAEHPDAEQDEELVKTMLSKYLGEPDHSDEDKAEMKQAYQAAMESGLEGKEAEKAAGYHMKMCKQAKQKQMQAEKSAMEADADGKGLDVKAKAVGDAGTAKGLQKSKESARSGVQGGNDVVKLTAEVARLSAQLEAINLEKHMDKALRESKLPMSATKKFRECAKSVRSVKEFNEKLSVFKEAYSLRGEAQSEPGFILGAERQAASDESGSGMDFSDCTAE